MFTEIGLSGKLSDLPVSIWVALAPTLTIFDVQREAGGWQDLAFCCRRVFFTAVKLYRDRLATVAFCS